MAALTGAALGSLRGSSSQAPVQHHEAAIIPPTEPLEPDVKLAANELPKDIIPESVLATQYNTHIINPSDGPLHTELFFRESALEQPIFQYLGEQIKTGQNPYRFFIIPIDNIQPRVNFLTEKQKALLPPELLSYMRESEKPWVNEARERYNKARPQRLAEWQKGLNNLTHRLQSGTITKSDYDFEVNYLAQATGADEMWEENPSDDIVVKVIQQPFSGYVDATNKKLFDPATNSYENMVFVTLAVGEHTKDVKKLLYVNDIPIVPPEGDREYPRTKRTVAPHPEDSYPQPEDFSFRPQPQYPEAHPMIRLKPEMGMHGFILDHEIAHINPSDPARMIPHPYPDYQAYNRLVDASNLLKQTGSDRKSYIVIKNKYGTTISKHPFPASPAI